MSELIRRRVLVGAALTGALGLGWLLAPDPPLPPGAVADAVVVDKTARRLTLYHAGRPLKSYRVALGRGGGTKRRQGDLCTPEGTYRIAGRQPLSAYHRALRLSYPNPQDLREARQAGVDPGEDIVIHGLPPRWAWVGRLHTLLDWTRGCIALTNRELDELWRAVPVGTPVRITP